MEKKATFGVRRCGGSGFPLKFGACREEPGGAEGVPIGEPEAADAFERLHGGGHASSMEAESLRGGFAGFGKVDPDDTSGVVGSGRKVLLLRKHGADGDGRGIRVDVKRTGFFDLDDAVFLNCGESGVRYHIEDPPFTASAQAGAGASHGHDGDEAAVAENFESGDIGDRCGDLLGWVGWWLQAGGGDFFDFEWLHIRHTEAGAGGGLGAEGGIEFAQKRLVAMEALGDEFPRGAVGEEIGCDHFLIGRRWSRSRLGLGIRLAGWVAHGAGGLGRGNEAEVLDAEGVGVERVGREFLGALDNGGVVERFAPRGLVKMECLAENRVRNIAERAGPEALVVQENAQQEDFGFRDVRGLWRAGGGCGGLGRAFEKEFFLRCRDAQLLSDLQEIGFKCVEFLQLGDGELELLGDVDEDIAFFDYVDVLVRRGRSRVGCLRGRALLQNGNLARREAPGGRSGRGDIPFPFYGALEAGLDALRLGAGNRGGEEEKRGGKMANR